MIPRVLSLTIVAALAAVLSGCSSTSPTKGEDVPSLQQIDKVIGAGLEATAGRIITVRYSLWLYSGAAAAPDHKGAFKESSTFSFQLGAGQVIRGWDVGVPGMKVGGQRTLIVPSSLGYGPSGTSGIPGGQALVFDIELLDVR